MSDNSILYYVHDPMCSWCWGFRKTWERVIQQLPAYITIQYVLGGLAPDSNEPMSQSMQINIRDTWRNIQKEIPGTEFNFDFWETCKPRRSTYISCRAVIAARKQNVSMENEMILAIQHAYYLKARNPSEEDVLTSLAEGIKLDTSQFVKDLNSNETINELAKEIELARKMGIHSFPDLVFEKNGVQRLIQNDYNDAVTIINQLI